MNSAAALANESRSAVGWLAAGTAANNAAVLMRTPGLTSDSSGDATGQISRGGVPASISSPPRRTIGSGSDRADFASARLDGDTRVASSPRAPARAKPGAPGSDATAASSGAAFG